jgi:hypothetical protein
MAHCDMVHCRTVPIAIGGVAEVDDPRPVAEGDAHGPEVDIDCGNGLMPVSALSKYPPER